MQDINRTNIYDILHKNLGFEIIETPIGKAVKMPAIDAFLFSNITGAGYLDNPTFLFSPKGTQKILREAFEYHFVTGIFNGTSLFYCPIELQKKKPYLFSGDKYVVFKEFTDECALTEEVQANFDLIYESGKPTTDYIIARIEAAKNGNGMEPFLEYMACEHFKRHGFIVENQVPLAATVGSPDFGGYKLRSAKTGFHINELSLIRITRDLSLLDGINVDGAIVGEAKTSTTIMEKQLRKYMNTGLFSLGYELHPYKIEPSIAAFGLLNFTDDCMLRIREPKESYAAVSSTTWSKTNYLAWLNNYLKFFLMANLSKDEFDTFISDKLNKRKYTVDEMVGTITGLSFEKIVSTIKEVL